MGLAEGLRGLALPPDVRVTRPLQRGENSPHHAFGAVRGKPSGPGPSIRSVGGYRWHSPMRLVRSTPGPFQKRQFSQTLSDSGVRIMEHSPSLVLEQGLRCRTVHECGNGECRRVIRGRSTTVRNTHTWGREARDGPASALVAQHEPRPLRWRRRCRGAGSNCRHADFQSAALPLSYLGVQRAIVATARRRCQAGEVQPQPARAGTAPDPTETGKALPGLLVHGVAQALQEAEHSHGDQQSANGNGKPGECPD